MKPIHSRKFCDECRLLAAQYGLVYEVAQGKRHIAHIFKLSSDHAVHCTLFSSRSGEVTADILRRQREWLNNNSSTNEAFRLVLKLHHALCRDAHEKKSASDDNCQHRVAAKFLNRISPRIKSGRRK